MATSGLTRRFAKVEPTGDGVKGLLVERVANMQTHVVNDSHCATVEPCKVPIHRNIIPTSCLFDRSISTSLLRKSIHSAIRPFRFGVSKQEMNKNQLCCLASSIHRMTVLYVDIRSHCPRMYLKGMQVVVFHLTLRISRETVNDRYSPSSLKQRTPSF